MSDSVRAIDGSPPGSSVPGILHARDWSGLPVPSPTHPRMLSRFRRVQLCVTPWTAAHQALLSTGFSRQEHEWVAVAFSQDISYLPELHSSVPILSFARICFPISLFFAFLVHFVFSVSLMYRMCPNLFNR